MKLLSRCYYHPRTNSVITDRSFLDSHTLSGLQNLLPEAGRYELKYVTVCLEDGIAGEVDRDSLLAALEVFGQIRDTGATPGDVLRALEKKSGKVAPAVKATKLAARKAMSPRIPRQRKSGKNQKRGSARAGGNKNDVR